MAIHFDTQGPAPDGFHVPLTDEWQWLNTIMTSLSLTTWDNWRINLHMPFAGYRYQSNAVLNGQGSNGYYWSSSPYGSANPNGARRLYLDSSNVNTNNNNTRANGFSVRCFKNSYVVPTSSWTVINWTLWGAWIFRNQIEWLISITSDWATWYTIQDKNLWATTIYNDGDTLTQANMWNMYQWWNNYWFPSTWSISKTSSTQVDASNYWPWNYYESDTFITWRNDWSSVQNDNLWWWVTQWTWYDPMKLHWHIGTWHMEHPLLSRSGLTAIGTIANMLVELNKAPARYYNKFNSEGHIYNYTSGSIVYKCLSNDWTSIYYQSGTWKYAYYNESTWLWVGAWGWVY